MQCREMNVNNAGIIKYHRAAAPQRILFRAIFLPLAGCLVLLIAAPAATAELEAFERCLLEAFKTADDAATLGDLRRRCRREIREEGPAGPGAAEETRHPQDIGALEMKLALDDRLAFRPFTLMAHKPNYLLFASYNASGVNPEPLREYEDDPNYETDNVEAKFQLSFKMPLLVGLFDNRVDVFAAYTNRSFWQVYNDRESRPFRDIDHEPEAWVQVHNDFRILGFTNRLNSVGISHQSNGRSGSLSRSWNRLYAEFLFELENLVISLKPWYRIPEDGDDDDNPDITDYMGHGELRGAYRWGDHTFSLMLRNNLESTFRRGAVELGWSFPLWEYRFFRGYIQYFNGYGESLIDYDQHANSIGAGISLTDWL